LPELLLELFVGSTRIIVIVVGGGLVIGLLCFARVVFMSKLGFSLLISYVSILGLLLHKLESLRLAIASGGFILKVIQ
jgi:hypothetical protein